MTFFRMGLRARVITSFAIGALFLSALLSLATYSLTRANLVETVREEARFNTATNASSINDRVTQSTRPAEFVDFMERLPTPPDSMQVLLHSNEFYFVDPLRFSDIQVDEQLKELLLAGRAAQMIYPIEGEAHYVVGYLLPFAESNASYIQATPLGDIEGTLTSLALTLLGAAAVTTIIGMAFGVYVAGRVLTPISEISIAAELIAHGDLSTRLEAADDPDLNQLVESFNDMTTALQERILRDSRFASDVSHELRSPLMTLTGSVALLERRRDEMPERAQLALDLLSADLKRFKQLLEDLLEISRFDVGAVQLDIEEVILGEFVRQAIGAAVGRERIVPIVHSGGSDDVIVELDKRRIAQVIRNLSENADKYANGVTQIRLQIEGDSVNIQLEDEGPGVPEDERELIFERFARGSEGGRRGSGTGVGLGLSLVTEHLRLHNGTVTVADRVDGLLGARFIISLPNVIVE